ncbi:MAG TPA: RNA polymerase sigma factor [Bacilli bacterium]
MASVEAKSIEEICSATWEPLYRFIYYKVQNREEAEDITQETYVKAYAYLQSGKVAPNKYITFLKTIAQNLLRDGWRKKKRRGTAVRIEAIDPTCYAAEDHAEASADRQVLEDALSGLPQEQRTVIELRIIKGFSVAETAEIMGKQEVNIRVMQYRALRRLAAVLQIER